MQGIAYELDGKFFFDTLMFFFFHALPTEPIVSPDMFLFMVPEIGPIQPNQKRCKTFRVAGIMQMYFSMLISLKILAAVW